jgi:hypothetical protein
VTLAIVDCRVKIHGLAIGDWRLGIAQLREALGQSGVGSRQ